MTTWADVAMAAVTFAGDGAAVLGLFEVVVMWPFRRKPPAPLCCADAARIQLALGVIEKALSREHALYPEDRDEQLINLALDITEVLTPTSVTGRS